MSYDTNKTLDSKATNILTLVHSDLAGPIQSLAKDGYKYIINFIDDYSGLTMLYLLKHKSDTLLATKKYLAGIAPYGHVKCLWTDNGMEFTLEPCYLYLIESNTRGQYLIFCSKVGPLYGHGKLYFLWQGISLLSQNCLKTCGFTHWWLQCIFKLIVTIKTQEKPHMKVLPVQNQT